MPGRKFTSTTNYRYGFNGKEEDDEVKGDGNQQDYGMRIYDTRLGRFLSVDPITKEYPDLTPYQFASNTPIQAIDLDGLEGVSISDVWHNRANLVQWINEDKPNGLIPIINRSINLFYIANAHGYEITRGKDYYTGEPKSRVQASTDAGVTVMTTLTFTRFFNMFRGSAALETQMNQNAKAIGPTVTNTQSNPQLNVSPKGNQLSPTVGTNTTNNIVPVLDKIGRRKQYAENVFRSLGEKSEKDVKNLMSTVDFSRAVQQRTLNVGDKIYRFERINSKGGDEMHFFTDAIGADAGATGVGFASPEGYKLVTYEVTRVTKVMESRIRYTGNKQYVSKELQSNIKKITEE